MTARNAPFGVMMVGVGGQGIILASDVLSEAALYAGFDVKKSEVHGMSQRGGAVVSHVRFGERVWSPMIPEGQADALVAFEAAEALRALHLLREDAKVVMSPKQIIPPVVSTSKQITYPEDPVAQVRARFAPTTVIDADAEARALGSEKMASVVLLGALSAHVDFGADAWRQAIVHRVPRGTEDANWRAFERGRALVG